MQRRKDDTMEEKLKIKLVVAGHKLPLTIERSDEEKYRRAEREINQLYAQYKAHYATKSDAECLAMAAVQIGKRSVDVATSRTLGSEMDELVEMDRELDEYLNRLK